jgi:hypothetical protein
VVSNLKDPALLAMGLLRKAFAEVKMAINDERLPVLFVCAYDRENEHPVIATTNSEYALDMLLPVLQPSNFPVSLGDFPLKDVDNVLELLSELEQIAVQNDHAMVVVLDFGWMPVVWRFHCTWCEAQWLIATVLDNREKIEEIDSNEQDN